MQVYCCPGRNYEGAEVKLFIQPLKIQICPIFWSFRINPEINSKVSLLLKFLESWMKNSCQGASGIEEEVSLLLLAKFSLFFQSNLIYIISLKKNAKQMKNEKQ